MSELVAAGRSAVSGDGRMVVFEWAAVAAHGPAHGRALTLRLCRALFRRKLRRAPSSAPRVMTVG
jgi:hypothetical protein